MPTPKTKTITRWTVVQAEDPAPADYARLWRDQPEAAAYAAKHGRTCGGLIPARVTIEVPQDPT